MCDESLVRPRSIIFRNSLNSCIVIPVHKEDDKQYVNDYHPMSLLPVFGKIFEKIIFNELYSFLDREKLISTIWFMCKPLTLTITHEVFLHLIVILHSIFSVISKAFDKVWHEGLLFSLKSFGISGNWLNFIKPYLTDRFQRVLLNGHCSNWQPVLVGVPKDPFCDPCFF